MEGANDRKNFPPNISEAADVSASKNSVLSLSPPSFSSDLVTRTKLLTREEECTLKTALAFVVIKARANARARAVSSETSSPNNYRKNNRSKKQRIVESSTTKSDGTENKHHHEIAAPSPSTSPSPTALDSSILDHLFHQLTSSCNDGHELSKRCPSSSLECSGGRTHIDHMFRAAKTLAETWLATKRNQQLKLRREQPPKTTKTKSNTYSTTKALVGATGHLAHQLQLLLVSNPISDGTKQKSSVTQSSFAKPKARDKHVIPKVRYRRPSLSSKSAADSMATPSSSSRISDAVVVVTPATNHSGSTNNNKNDPSNGNESNTRSNNNSMGTTFLVQKWIRSTLLQQDDQQQHASTATNMEAKASRRTIISCQSTTLLDMLASFHVYSVMIPQIARISPPLIGHIFQVVAKLLKDLYNDKITVIGEESAFVGGDDSERDFTATGRKDHTGQLLNHMATSALKLLELCWITKIASSRSSSEESHRSFLLRSLQEILGDLLVPLSRSELAGEHYRLTVSASRDRIFQHRQHDRQKQDLSKSSRSTESRNQKKAQQQRRLVLQRRNQSESRPIPHDQIFPKAQGHSLPPADTPVRLREDAWNDQPIVPKSLRSRVASLRPPKQSAFVDGCLLDPEAKLLLRMAVYRLILVKEKI